MKKSFNSKESDKSTDRTYNGGMIYFRNCDCVNDNIECEGLIRFSYPVYRKQGDGKTTQPEYVNLIPVTYGIRDGLDLKTTVEMYDSLPLQFTEVSSMPLYPIPPTVKERFDKEFLTDREFKLMQDWTYRTKLDSVMDVSDKDGYGRVVCVDYENDGKEISLTEGFEFFSSAIAYSFEHEGFTREESKILYDLFKRITGTDYSYLYQTDLERGDIEEPIR